VESPFLCCSFIGFSVCVGEIVLMCCYGGRAALGGLPGFCLGIVGYDWPGRGYPVLFCFLMGIKFG
jgi:hypothetical protein